jgi:membrane dipeptidase
MTRKLVIDCHADTLLKKYFADMARLMFDNPQTFHVSKELLIQGRIDIQVFALFVPPMLEKIGIDVTLELIALAKEMEKKGDFSLIKSKADLKKLKNKNEEVGMILSLEGTVALERRPKILPILYELGIRNIGLTWSRKNLFAEGSIIDVSHLNVKGFTDVVKLTTNPFIASHSNVHKLCPISRNLTDDQLIDIANADGVVGINFYPKFLKKKDPESATIADVIKHIKYIANLTSVDNVGLGSDFDGIPITPKGLENASKINDIAPLLDEEGFSKKEIEKIMGGNFERVFTKVWEF